VPRNVDLQPVEILERGWFTVTMQARIDENPLAATGMDAHGLTEARA
jgi:hypothetical protein